MFSLRAHRHPLPSKPARHAQLFAAASFKKLMGREPTLREVKLINVAFIHALWLPTPSISDMSILAPYTPLPPGVDYPWAPEEIVVAQWLPIIAVPPGVNAQDYVLSIVTRALLLDKAHPTRERLSRIIAGTRAVQPLLLHCLDNSCQLLSMAAAARQLCWAAIASSSNTIFKHCSPPRDGISC